MTRSEKVIVIALLLTMAMISVLCTALLNRAAWTCENVRLIADRDLADMHVRSLGKPLAGPLPDSCNRSSFPWYFG